LVRALSPQLRCMNIIFITGSSGVGKTPLVEILKSVLPDSFEIYDLDEKLIEVDKTKPNWLYDWRNNATSYFVDLASENAKQNKSTIVCGIIWPSEVQAVPNIKSVPPIKFIFLDVEPEELRKRFFARRWSDESKIVNLKRDTGMTPDEYIQKNAIEVTKLKKECIESGAKIINTTNLESEMVAIEIRDYLLK